SRHPRHRDAGARPEVRPCTRSPCGRKAKMSPSMATQDGAGRDGDARRGGRAASTTGQRAELAERLRSHVATLEGVRHPTATPERHRAARDYLVDELKELGIEVQLAPFTFRGRTYHN